MTKKMEGNDKHINYITSNILWIYKYSYLSVSSIVLNLKMLTFVGYNPIITDTPRCSLCDFVF